MKYLTLILAVIVAGLIIYILLLPHPENPAIKHHQDSVVVKKAHIEQLIKRESILIEKIKTDSAENKSREIAYNEQITALKRQATSRKSRLVEKLVADTSLLAFSNLQDSIIRVQDARIDTLQNEKERQWSTFNEMIKVEDQKFDESQAINRNLEAIISIQNKDNKRLRRQNTWLKVGIGAVAVGGVIIIAR